MEPQAITDQLTAELGALKEKDPAAYLELLKQLNETLEELARDLEDIAST